MQRNRAISIIKNSLRVRTIDVLEAEARASLLPAHDERPVDDAFGGKTGWSRDLAVMHSIVFSGWLNLLLLCIPAGFAAQYLAWPAVWRFSLNFLSLIPLALILGDVTEDLALRFGDVIGGLINATFGNVVEVILSLAALEKGLYDVVASSLLGSILSNMLLVLGCCYLFGGLYYKTQSFNAIGNRACSSLLFLSTIGIITPTAAFQLIPEISHDSVLVISRACAIILLIMYALYLLFQLNTHAELFSGDEDEGGEQPALSVGAATFLLTGITVLVAFSSEFLTGSIEEVSASTGLGHMFLGMIVLPIAGNACEHMTAVIVAMKDKMDLSMGVVMGSSLQIALFALPLCVVVGWATGHDFSLNLDAFSALALTVSVIHSSIVTNDATSHWLLGTQLIAVYIIFAISYLVRT